MGAGWRESFNSLVGFLLTGLGYVYTRVYGHKFNPLVRFQIALVKS